MTDEPIKPRRRLNSDKYARAFDKLHGLRLVEDAFDKLTPDGFKPTKPPKNWPKTRSE